MLSRTRQWVRMSRFECAAAAAAQRGRAKFPPRAQPLPRDLYDQTTSAFSRFSLYGHAVAFGATWQCLLSGRKMMFRADDLWW
eukprot:3007827-Rhodomonas_salina.1